MIGLRSFLLRQLAKLMQLLKRASHLLYLFCLLITVKLLILVIHLKPSGRQRSDEHLSHRGMIIIKASMTYYHYDQLLPNWSLQTGQADLRRSHS